MKTRVFPSILVAASVFSLYGEPPIDWERVGENWGNSFQYTKDGIKRLTGEEITKNMRLYGHNALDNVTFKKNLTCYGYAELQSVTVQGVTTMFGPLSADHCLFKDMDVRCYNEMIGKGVVQLNNSSVQKLTLNGILKADSCTIDKIITFGADTELVRSTVKEIVVLNKAHNEKTPIVLTDTTVEGNISFSQKGGIVICKGTSTIHGTVTNGIIKKG